MVGKIDCKFEITNFDLKLRGGNVMEGVLVGVPSIHRMTIDRANLKGKISGWKK